MNWENTVVKISATNRNIDFNHPLNTYSVNSSTVS